MPFCPMCRCEYVEGVASCPDCGSRLVAELPGGRDEPRMASKLVTVATFNFPIDAEMAKLRLESEGIRCFLANEILSILVVPMLEIYPVKVQVGEEDARRAAELLAADR